MDHTGDDVAAMRKTTPGGDNQRTSVPSYKTDDSGLHGDEKLSAANRSRRIIDSASTLRAEFLEELREDGKHPFVALSACLSQPVNHVDDGLSPIIHDLVKMALRERGSENASNPLHYQVRTSDVG